MCDATDGRPTRARRDRGFACCFWRRERRASQSHLHDDDDDDDGTSQHHPRFEVHTSSSASASAAAPQAAPSAPTGSRRRARARRAAGTAHGTHMGMVRIMRNAAQHRMRIDSTARLGTRRHPTDKPRAPGHPTAFAAVGHRTRAHRAPMMRSRAGVAALRTLSSCMPSPRVLNLPGIVLSSRFSFSHLLDERGPELFRGLGEVLSEDHRARARAEAHRHAQRHPEPARSSKATSLDYSVHSNDTRWMTSFFCCCLQ